MGYGDLSHTEVSISYEVKLSGMYETEVCDKSHIPGWLLDKYFIPLQGSFQLNQVKESSHGVW